MLRTAPSRIVVLIAAHFAIIMIVFLSTGPSSGPKSTSMNDKVLAGQQVWQDSKCISCHAIYGLGGHMGPDLTNAVTRAGDETIIAVLRYGMGAMPPQELADGEAEELVAYLRYVDSTGVYPTRSFPGFAFGRTGQD